VGGDDTSIEETEDEKMLAQIGVEKFRDYKRLYTDVENEFFDSVDDLNSEETMQRGANAASVNVSEAYSDANSAMKDSMAKSGINPNESGFKQAVMDSASREKSARITNPAKTQQALQDQHLTGKQAIVAMGQGQEADAINGFATIANESANEASSQAIRDFDDYQSNLSTIATGAGMAAGAYNNATKEHEESNQDNFQAIPEGGTWAIS
jgi:hypothetical protein